MVDGSVRDGRRVQWRKRKVWIGTVPTSCRILRLPLWRQRHLQERIGYIRTLKCAFLYCWIWQIRVFYDFRYTVHWVYPSYSSSKILEIRGKLNKAEHFWLYLIRKKKKKKSMDIHVAGHSSYSICGWIKKKE